MAEGGSYMKEKKTVKENKDSKAAIKDKNARMAIVKKLMDKGKKNGSITYKEIMNELEEIDITPEQIERYMKF